MASRKEREAAALAAAMKQATDDAQRLFKQHEKERLAQEQADKFQRDSEAFDRELQVERLEKEQVYYSKIVSELREAEERDFREHQKHAKWDHIVDASWLPSVSSEGEINTFISSWREEQETSMDVIIPNTVVKMRCTIVPKALTVDHMDVFKNDQCPSAQFRRARVKEFMEMCTKANTLTEEIWRDADLALVAGDAKQMSFDRRMLLSVYDQILHSIDASTVNVLQYLDQFIESDDEPFMKSYPSDAPSCVKFGVWARAMRENQRAIVSYIKYPAIGVSIDPKPDGGSKLPRALSRETIAMRIVQLTFDPFSVASPTNVGQAYYALNCVLIVDPIPFPDRPKRTGDWVFRVETANAKELTKMEYPPQPPKSVGGAHDTQTQMEDATIKITFEVPDNVVVRNRTPMIGKWNKMKKQWDVCGNNINYDPILRKLSFLTSDLSELALIQEKGFDVPYEQWQLCPFNDDQVLFTVEGKKRGELSDREIRLLVWEDKCKLVAPDDPQLQPLREQWLPPPTMLRLLAGAGFNLMLTDADAEHITNLLPKSKEMEQKGYQDLAMFCSLHSFASTRHNKMGEDRDMALFRMTKEQSDVHTHSAKPFQRDVDDDTKWHSIRYERTRCCIAQFKDSDDEPNLSTMSGKLTHLNLVTLLTNEYGKEAVEAHMRNANFLLHSAVLQLLQLTRPFTWG